MDHIDCQYWLPGHHWRFPWHCPNLLLLLSGCIFLPTDQESILHQKYWDNRNSLADYYCIHTFLQKEGVVRTRTPSPLKEFRFFDQKKSLFEHGSPEMGHQILFLSYFTIQYFTSEFLDRLHVRVYTIIIVWNWRCLLSCAEGRREEIELSANRLHLTRMTLIAYDWKDKYFQCHSLIEDRTIHI